jgi:hypothetical protein
VTAAWLLADEGAAAVPVAVEEGAGALWPVVDNEDAAGPEADNEDASACGRRAQCWWHY